MYVQLLNKLPFAWKQGPAIRRDKKTINKHLKLIESPDLKSIYKVFTLAIQKNNEK